MKQTNIVIIGAGPAGLAAAIAAYDAGAKDILLLEREENPGGILRQCIHTGFGLHRFGEELSGPEYAARFVEEVNKRNIEIRTGTTVLDITKDKIVTATSGEYGIFHVQAKAIILAMGCRERPRGALSISGSRPAGVYTAGTAQKWINLEGMMPGKEVVILGSGDIGLIMARRMTLEGAKVHAVLELIPHSSGLKRNIVQCLDDFGIPLLLSHTVAAIHGKDRVEGVTIAAVDDSLRIIEETKRRIDCDTLLLSCGLIPENELTKGMGLLLSPLTSGAEVDENRQTAIEGVFACGNVLHVHDLVDFVSEEAEIAGKAAAAYVSGTLMADPNSIRILPGNGVRYTLPHKLHRTGKGEKVYFRVTKICQKAQIVLKNGETVLYSRKKPHMAPGEMEQITLPSSLPEDITELTLCIKEED